MAALAIDNLHIPKYYLRGVGDDLSSTSRVQDYVHVVYRSFEMDSAHSFFHLQKDLIILEQPGQQDGSLQP